MWPDRTCLRLDDIFMEVGSNQEVGQLGTAVGMLLPNEFYFVFVEILTYISGKKGNSGILRSDGYKKKWV